jgi:hypothetical protein
MKKKLILICLALGLSVSLIAQSSSQSQGSQQPSDNTSKQSQPSQDNSKSDQQMSGKVSDNGKTFTSDQDNKSYTVSNPDALKGLEGQHVALIVHVDPDTGVVRIMQVEAQPQQQP